MSNYLFIPPAREVRGTVTAPPSKSATNRALVLAALSPRTVRLIRPLESEDTRALVRCLTAMHASIEACGDGLAVHGPLAGTPDREVVLDAGESGTAARFLLALAAVTGGRFLLTGAARLRERPMAGLVTALSTLGARIVPRAKRGFLPLAIEGAPLASGSVTVDASQSSQFISALLLAGAAVEGGLAVEASGPVASSPYVAMTVESLRAFGHSVDTRSGLRVLPGRVPPERYEVLGDFSSALPLLAAVGVVGGQLQVTGLPWPSPDADALALPVLARMGIDVSAEPNRIGAQRLGDLKSVVVRATDFPDAVPPLVALAAFAPGRSRFDGIGHLRWKESDRIAALAALLEGAGVKVHTEKEAIAVEGPVSPHGRGDVRRLPTFGDHRIVMAGALLSLGLPGLALENPDSVAKSYPHFFRDLESILSR
jgi:3-phosphoshikimate 1-carboxyvinyltransferase